MQQESIDFILNTSKTLAEQAYMGFAAPKWRPINLLWQMAEEDELPPADRISVFTSLESMTDKQYAYSDRELLPATQVLYRAMGRVAQNVMVPKKDGGFYAGNKYVSELQDGWRKSRGRNISFYDPFITYDVLQPDQKFLSWTLRVVYDILERVI